MSKILVVGTGPLFTPEQKLFCGQSLRTWHLTKPLRDAGHAVDLAVIQTDGFPSEATGAVHYDRYDELNYVTIASHDPAVVLPALQNIVDSRTHDCIVAINANAAAIVAQLQTTLPMWADLMGHMMGEAQAKCIAEENDDLLRHFWSRQRAILRRCDRLSVSGFKQMHAVIGELSVLGRINSLTAAHPFATLIPIAADPMFLNMDLPLPNKRYRGHAFPEDTFAVLWTGGYNTWTDVKALAASLTLAMEQVPRLRFISTGGAIPGHDEKTYPAFVEEMRRSGFEDRCHFLGWIEGGEVPQLYAECDLGLNIDGLNYETLLGGRNRLVNLMAAGVPVLTTLGTEISETIAENRLGYTVKIGREQEYAEAMIRACKFPLERRQLAQRARTYVKQNFAPEMVVKSLLRWVAEPDHAPDNEAKIRRFPQAKMLQGIALNPLEEEALALEDNALEELAWLRDEVGRLESELAQLKGSKFFKIREQVQKVKQLKPRKP